MHLFTQRLITLTFRRAQITLWSPAIPIFLKSDSPCPDRVMRGDPLPHSAMSHHALFPRFRNVFSTRPLCLVHIYMMILYLMYSYSSANSFSSISSVNSTSAMSTHVEDTPTNTSEGNTGRGDEPQAEVLPTQLPSSNGEDFSGSSIDARNVPFGLHSATAIFPEVHMVTGKPK